MEVFSYISIVTKIFLSTATELQLGDFSLEILNILYFFVSIITKILQKISHHTLKDRN